jgi:hypothetical protein
MRIASCGQIDQRACAAAPASFSSQTSKRRGAEFSFDLYARHKSVRE